MSGEQRAQLERLRADRRACLVELGRDPVDDSPLAGKHGLLTAVRRDHESQRSDVARALAASSASTWVELVEQARQVKKSLMAATDAQAYLRSALRRVYAVSDDATWEAVCHWVDVALVAAASPSEGVVIDAATWQKLRSALRHDAEDGAESSDASQTKIRPGELGTRDQIPSGSLCRDSWGDYLIRMDKSYPHRRPLPLGQYVFAKMSRPWCSWGDRQPQRWSYLVRDGRLVEYVGPVLETTPAEVLREMAKRYESKFGEIDFDPEVVTVSARKV